MNDEELWEQLAKAHSEGFQSCLKLLRVSRTMKQYSDLLTQMEAAQGLRQIEQKEEVNE